LKQNVLKISACCWTLQTSNRYFCSFPKPCSLLDNRPRPLWNAVDVLCEIPIKLRKTFGTLVNRTRN